MRLFVALSIPVDVRENLSSMIDELRRADARPRWVNPLNLHITLKFIGEVSSDGVTEIATALGKVHAAQHVKLGFGGIGFFPNARRPNVAWIGIESSPNLAPLASDVNLALSPLGIARERSDRALDRFFVLLNGIGHGEQAFVLFGRGQFGQLTRSRFGLSGHVAL